MNAAASPLSLPRLSRYPALGSALAAAERAARSDAPILILGEAGTGRTTLARALHAASSRARAPLVEVDAGGIPATLFESELFGHRRGAFTGAERTVKGRVELAERGSLLLDRVEELPIAVQGKLLRLLAEHRYAPLGGGETEADVRFLATAAPDLAERAEAGRFRPDLYYRLEVLCLRLPPLRERRADLPELIAELLADLAARFGRPAPDLAERAREWMLAHPWPGNLRELRNVLERGLVAWQSGPLDPPPPTGSPGARPRRLEEVEEEEIRRALAYARGRQGRAAELLGISRKSLWEKRRKFGIP
ncbi:MAG TPA: sigma 54-interacting transcriptional regulator [Thermoanaerobaculia bacterium]|nr:sigma 54-interacting transcriptional regulator [Thermoanaerobaculia bacterium]